MRITTKLTVDMTTGTILEHKWYEYKGPVLLCKGDSTDKQMEQQEDAFQQQLQSIFSSQYATQTNTLNYLNSKMQSQINQGGQGYNPQTLAAMRTQATDQNAAAAQQAKMSTQNQEDLEGGQNLPSGVNAQINSSINTAAAENEAGTQEGITQANANLQNQNYWNATNVLSGNAAQENPGQYGSLFNGAGSTGASLSQAYTASDQSQLLGALGGIAGGAGSAFGGAMSGGLLCPSEGSMFLLPDGTSKAVETLVIGEQIAGKDGEKETINKIVSAYLPILHIKTSDGYILSNSYTHCYMLSNGGFTLAAEAFGKEIVTHTGFGRVISVEAVGPTAKVFSIETDGSHTYEADGVWAFGVGHVDSDKAAKLYLEKEMVNA